MNGWELVARYAREYEGDADEAAAALLQELRAGKHVCEALAAVVADAIAHARRGDVQRVERAAFGGSARRPLGDMLAGSVDERKALLDSSFALPDGRLVRWSDATVGDHADRIAMLTKLRDGLDTTIARHAQAIEAIEVAGVVCLGEIKDAA